MEFDLIGKYVLLFLGGLFSGVVNVLAGGGSFVTLPILSLFGLSPSVANGTNRIAILLQNVSATASFAKNRMLDFQLAAKLLIPTVVGAILGTSIAIKIPERWLQTSLGVIFLFMAVYMTLPEKPKQRTQDRNVTLLLRYIVFFLIGIYGGYIQAGVGFFLVAALTKLEGMELKMANAMKIFLTLAFTVVALLLFTVGKKVEMVPGMVLGVGSFVGGALGAKLNSVLSVRIIKTTLIGMMIVSALLYIF
ncbi:sulfite exporter TauE/SafE family protein [Fervidobacterium thailandense]|uniref:Probable membrane transporter protein n=1 Tax=Fervidobacterium thailandense TaxID=1008305 RepID=A0A1E3G1T2_9BACT|nr:sulfite exporter TauE/SafE family protein [Fervidobacterium thailandense]ODN30205.1 integrase [Fervidobacterium thailandense]